MDYKGINDNEYIYLIKEGSEEASSILIKKYSPLIDKIASYNLNYAKNCGLDKNDLHQEGLLGLLNAIDNFDKEKDVTFYTYASVCIETKIRSYIRSAKRDKNKFLNESLSLDNTMDDDNSFYNLFEDENSDPSIKIEEKEYDNYVINELKKCLTSFEEKVLYYKLKNLTNGEIASILNKDKRSIENSLTRIKSKYHNMDNVNQI